MKKCIKCMIIKDSSCFRSRGNGKLQPRCKECSKIYDKDWHEKNKERINRLRRNKKKQRAVTIREIVRKYKNKPCRDCAQVFPFYVMQFDHILPNKEYNVSNMMTGGFSLKKIMEEVLKCEVVCANCHAIRTWSRRTKNVCT